MSQVISCDVWKIEILKQKQYNAFLCCIDSTSFKEIDIILASYKKTLFIKSEIRSKGRERMIRGLQEKSHPCEFMNSKWFNQYV